MEPLSKEASRTAARASALGIELGAGVILPLLAGYWADGKLQTAPWLTITGLIVGCGVGFKAIHAAAKQMQRDADRQARAERRDLGGEP